MCNSETHNLLFHNVSDGYRCEKSTLLDGISLPGHKIHVKTTISLLLVCNTST